MFGRATIRLGIGPHSSSCYTAGRMCTATNVSGRRYSVACLARLPLSTTNAICCNRDDSKTKFNLRRRSSSADTCCATWRPSAVPLSVVIVVQLCRPHTQHGRREFTYLMKYFVGRATRLLHQVVHVFTTRRLRRCDTTLNRRRLDVILVRAVQ